MHLLEQVRVDVLFELVGAVILLEESTLLTQAILEVENAAELHEVFSSGIERGCAEVQHQRRTAGPQPQFVGSLELLDRPRDSSLCRRSNAAPKDSYEDVPGLDLSVDHILGVRTKSRPRVSFSSNQVEEDSLTVTERPVDRRNDGLHARSLIGNVRRRCQEHPQVPTLSGHWRGQSIGAFADLEAPDHGHRALLAFMEQGSVPGWSVRYGPRRRFELIRWLRLSAIAFTLEQRRSGLAVWRGESTWVSIVRLEPWGRSTSACASS